MVRNTTTSIASTVKLDTTVAPVDQSVASSSNFNNEINQIIGSDRINDAFSDEEDEEYK